MCNFRNNENSLCFCSVGPSPLRFSPLRFAPGVPFHCSPLRFAPGVPLYFSPLCFAPGVPLRFRSNKNWRERISSRTLQKNKAKQVLMKSAMRQTQLKARAYHCALKLCCVIADLTGSEAITHAQLAKSLYLQLKLYLVGSGI
jgi:hypothetical protein